MKYQFYAIIFDVAGNQVSSKSSATPLSISSATQAVTGLTVSPSAAQVKNVGQTFTITPTISPSNANNKNVNWTSSNTNVATVSKTSTASGTAITVTCKAAGTTTITATAGDGSGKSVSVSLTVYDKVTVTAFSYSSTSINVGQVTAVPTKIITGTAKSGPTYSSSNTSVATVDSSGKVTGKAAGTATITISYTNYDGTTATKTCSITIKNSTMIAQLSSNNYGDYVNYPVDLGIKSAGKALADGSVPKTDWRIFYKDSTNIYLIAADFMPNSKNPSNVFVSTSGSYVSYWNSDSSKIPSATLTNKTNFLFTKLSKVSSSNNNYKAVLTLLDTSKWSKFVNSTYADACIGGPTLEMWVASWNQLYPSAMVYYDAASTGYRYSTSSSDLTSSWDFVGYTSLKDKTGYSNTLYFTHKSNWNSCNSYWVSAPSAWAGSSGTHSGRTVCNAYCSGLLSSATEDASDYGVRPVVCLKSTVSAQKDANGIWQLQ